MRIWLVEDVHGADSGGLEAALRQLSATESGDRPILVGISPADTCLARELRAQQVDALIVTDAAWPSEPVLAELLGTGVSILLGTSAEHCEPFQALAQLHPVWFIPRRPTPETLQLALRALAACSRRQSHWKAQLTGLQQRLNDRIVIERAKGILVQRLGVSEEEAYNRMRASSRRQRRQIRDVAQSLLDTQALLLPESNGYTYHTLHGGLADKESGS